MGKEERTLASAWKLKIDSSILFNSSVVRTVTVVWIAGVAGVEGVVGAVEIERGMLGVVEVV